MEGLGRWSQALEHYVRALRLSPDDPSLLCGAAWILATRPDEAERDARKAVAWAERAWQATGLQDPRVADVLAAAHAAAGQFEQAVRIAEQALQLAAAAHMDEFAEQVRQRLALYRQQQPFVLRAADDRS
jgi:tetratricopeptide (TPR) repeat protein